MKPTDPIPGFAPNTQINLLGKEVTVVRSQIGGLDRERYEEAIDVLKFVPVFSPSRREFFVAQSCTYEKFAEVATWTDGVVKTFKIDGPLLELVTEESGE